MTKYNSKSVRLAAVMEEDIRGGRFGASRQLPGENRLAELYGVSRSTIRRTLAELIGRGVLEHLPNCGVKPAPAVVAPDGPAVLAEAREPEHFGSIDAPVTIAWCFAAVPDAMLNNVTEGIKRYVGENGLRLQVINSANGHEPVLRSLNQCKSLGIDGVVVMPYLMDEYVENLSRLTASGVPVVSIIPMEEVDVSTVCGDDFNGAFNAVHRLLEKYDRPVYFIGAGESSTSQLRCEAFRLAMREAGFAADIDSHLMKLPPLGLDPEYWPMEAKWSHPGKSIAASAIGRIRTPASVMCENDYIAYGLYQAAEQSGLAIGKDLMVCGFDDIPMARRMTPPLSSMRVNSVEIGYQAARVLHQKITGEVSDRVHLKIPTEFIERESTPAAVRTEQKVLQPETA